MSQHDGDTTILAHSSWILLFLLHFDSSGGNFFLGTQPLDPTMVHVLQFNEMHIKLSFSCNNY